MKMTIMKPKPTKKQPAKKQPAKKQAKKKPVNIGLLRNLEDSLQNAGTFRVLASLAPVGIYLTKPDGTCAYANPAWCNAAGLRLEEALGMGWIKGLHPDDRDSVFANWQKMVDSKGRWGMEYRFQTSDGNVTTVYGLATPQYDASGTIVGYVGVNIDITERKRAEELAQKSEELLRSVFNATPFPVAVVDTQDDRIFYWSQSAITVFGHTAPTAKEWYQIAYPDPDYRNDVIARWKPHLEAARLSGQPVNTGEYRVTCRDGSVRICELYAAFVQDFLIVTFNDITERKKADDQLARGRSLLADTARIGKVGGWEFDIDTGKMTWTEETCGIHEVDVSYNPKVTDGIAFYTPESRPIIERCVQRAIEYDEPFDVDLEIVTAKGNLKTVNAIGKVDLKQRRVYGFFQDITRRKKVEEMLHTKNAELESFTYAVTHDLKSPVVTIQSFMRHMEKDLAASDIGKIRDDVKFIKSAADKIGHMLDELLEISRVGRLIGTPSHVSAKDLVNEVVNTVAGRIADRGVDVKVAHMDVSLYGDLPRLAEIWQNLIENACKFMGNQTAPCIEIGMRREERGAVERKSVEGVEGTGRPPDRETVAAPDQATAVFFVRDNGIGIDPRHHSRVFDLFERLDEHIEGTGMGLAIVKRIVELYQGRIWVESIGAGQGTCFCFTLPRAIKTEGKT